MQEKNRIDVGGTGRYTPEFILSIIGDGVATIVPRVKSPSEEIREESS
jgi:hypothetical protein